LAYHHQNNKGMKTSYQLLTIMFLFSGCVAAQKVGVGTGSGTGTGTSTGTTSPSTQTSPTTGGKSNLGGILDQVTGGGSNSGVNFTQNEAAQAIKEALSKGVTEGVKKVSVTDGYFKNSFIKIPFPKEVKVVETTMRQIGLGSLIDNFVLSLNRAAESAAKAATHIFINYIKQLTITDAINIVSNKQSDAATRFLERTTTEQLVTAFKPSIKTALDKSLATKYWKDITSRYNKIPFVSKVNTDLPDYATRKAITGLFYMVAQEEAKIRKDPKGAASSIIDKVFGSIKF
jgi:hypothetical protein